MGPKRSDIYRTESVRYISDPHNPEQTVFRISRLTDYGIVVMAHLAGCTDDDAHNARELASETRLPAPVVSKILKSLTRAQLLNSVRGAKGGYSLARPPGEISVVEMIVALEGPLGITECAIHPGSCAQEANCVVRDPWQMINGAVHAALERITLADLTRPVAESSDVFVPFLRLDAESKADLSPRSDPTE
jgi:FeS assembly SUF system regulator